MATHKKLPSIRASRGQVRIIGGKWRGRRLPIAPQPALRPSPDRVRETLFNWLAPYLSAAHCLDLFAGTGVLGLEAVSRGAASATLLEGDPLVAKFLRRHIDMLDANNVTVIEYDVCKWLRDTVVDPFDIVFLDPPFGQGYVEIVLQELARGWLKNPSWVYIEAEKIPILHFAADGWRLVRHGQTRQVHFALIEYNPKQTNS